MTTSLLRYVQVLLALADTPRDVFLASGDKIGNAKYHFVIAIECCVDIANHIIASEGYRIPRDNADTFAVLAEEGILPAEHLPALRAMARVQNRLIHLYWEADDESVCTYLQTDLADFDAFVASIAGWLSASQSRPTGGPNDRPA